MRVNRYNTSTQSTFLKSQTYTYWTVALEPTDILPVMQMLFYSLGDSVESSA